MVDSRAVGIGTATPRDCSSKMILFNNGCKAAVLLIALTQSLVCGSREDEKNNFLETMAANGILESLRVPWIDGFGLDIIRSDSPCGEEVGALVEAVKSGQMWALQSKFVNDVCRNCKDELSSVDSARRIVENSVRNPEGKHPRLWNVP